MSEPIHCPPLRLEPCPFCGNTDTRLTINAEDSQITCATCKSGGPIIRQRFLNFCRTKFRAVSEEACKLWNNRLSPAANGSFVIIDNDEPLTEDEMRHVYGYVIGRESYGDGHFQACYLGNNAFSHASVRDDDCVVIESFQSDRKQGYWSAFAVGFDLPGIDVYIANLNRLRRQLFAQLASKWLDRLQLTSNAYLRINNLAPLRNELADLHSQLISINERLTAYLNELDGPWNNANDAEIALGNLADDLALTIDDLRQLEAE